MGSTELRGGPVAQVDDRRQAELRRFVENVEQALARSPQGSVPASLNSIEGADGSGTVYCLVDLAGAPSDVVVLNGWWAALGAGGVGRAMLRALRSAQTKAEAARLVLAHHGCPVSSPRTQTSARLASPPPVELPPYDAPGFDDALLRKANRAAGVLEKAEQFLRDQEREQPREFRGPRGLVRVTTFRGVMTEIGVDGFGLQPSDGAELAADARDALRDATSSTGVEERG
jgi:hypothetical protein